MYERYEIPIHFAARPKEAPPRFEVIRGEDCIHCGTCESACPYGVHLKQEADARLMALPEEDLCVGCQRCVMECPVGVLDIGVHPDFRAIGKGTFRPRVVTRIWDEAESGRVPVSGAGYRGPFVQPGFDAIWTDMSEIVRPTRDGIHGREYISTAVDIGRKPPFLTWEEDESFPPILEIPVPFLLNPPGPIGRGLEPLVARAAEELGTYAILEAANVRGQNGHIIPRFAATEEVDLDLLEGRRAVEIDDAGDGLATYHAIKDARPDLVAFLRMPLRLDRREDYADRIRAGVDVLHLYADRDGREVGPEDSRFIAPVLRDLDQYLVEEGLRDEVTLLASGGIVASEHLPKALLCGADAVALDSTYLIALGWNGNPEGTLSSPIQTEWAVNRIKNWANACRDQLLEIMGAMGIRDARRMAGEIGRAMFHEDLEREFMTLFPGGKGDG
ncbi:MAG: 4Fe-4S dicluster domain-containing protein [Thermoplasmata archaeon]